MYISYVSHTVSTSANTTKSYRETYSLTACQSLYTLHDWHKSISPNHRYILRNVLRNIFDIERHASLEVVLLVSILYVLCLWVVKLI